MTRCRLCGRLHRGVSFGLPLHADFALFEDHGKAAFLCLSCALSNLDLVCGCIRPAVKAWLRRRA